MEEVCERENLTEALKRVRANRGSPGVDGMRVEELAGYLREHWPAIREQLLEGSYVPGPVKRVEIPKRGGGERRLGIPTVLDRFIQQAVLQVLQKHWDRTFSERSYGFRPRRSALKAVAQAQRYIGEGRRWVVDIDLEKFFDGVNHDRLMGRLAQRFEGQSGAQANPCVLECRSDGERAGESGDGGDAAGRPAVAIPVQRRAGRTGPGAGATRPPLCALRGRL